MVTPQKDHESIARRIGAANLLALRASTGLSQAQFAAAIGLSERALRRYERGERELPQATRLAVIERFKFDLLATDRLATEVGAAKVMLSPMPAAAIREPRDFWASLRQEQKVFREKNYTRLGQIILTWRDHAYFTATTYFAMKHLSFALNIPFGIEVHGIDWMFLASAATILLLISSVVAEMPVFKVARHLLRVGKKSL
ncbi:helix-turn-helix transcriptional regulator [Rhodovulum sulfidophilum]|uniref:helix-turn-helix domain-containing protein n=1 Tax=Rhodovulum sulfidophilum TaxID=35806 RepID=UPI001922E7F3|nr:helix-turn-helix transcriptional regulator [Rhodovulum sulfidophilum]MBL3596671.1 helix-turn-helix transcriptional regulator [Rhodovulum sulfidophilum]